MSGRPGIPVRQHEDDQAESMMHSPAMFFLRHEVATDQVQYAISRTVVETDRKPQCDVVHLYIDRRTAGFE